MLRKCDAERKCRDHVDTRGGHGAIGLRISEIVGMFSEHIFRRAHTDIDSARPRGVVRHGVECLVVCGVGLRLQRGRFVQQHRPACGRDGRVDRCTGRRAEIEAVARIPRSDRVHRFIHGILGKGHGPNRIRTIRRDLRGLVRPIGDRIGARAER